MKILLVDDARTDRLMVERHLKQLGHEVVIGTNGKEAVELFGKCQPDLVLLDEIMPEMRGHEAARQIRENRDCWTPIIFLSARCGPDDVVAGIEAGADDYLAKPINCKILEAKMMAMQRISEMRAQLLAMSSKLEAANEGLQRLVDVDGLTKLANRRYLDRMLSHEVARCGRSGEPMAVIMCDVDEFKSYNDHYGHLAGDDALKQVAKVMRRAFRRTTDVVARYGGEEFAVILPSTQPAMAHKLAENLRLQIARSALPHEKSSVASHLTVSIGIFCSTPAVDSAAEDFLVEADRALYTAKQGGRNQVVLFSVDDASSESLALELA